MRRYIALLALLDCHSAAKPTPVGTVIIEWKETTTTLLTGVGIGADIGAPIHENKTIELTPNGEVRDTSLKPARLELDVQRADVVLTPNATGGRPSERGAPRAASRSA